MAENLYGISTRVWAKSPRRQEAESSGWLSLIDHSIDVTAVAIALLRLPTIRARLGALAERELDDVDIARLCFMVGLHDAGKVNHGFQRKLRGERPYAGHIAPLWAIIGSHGHWSDAHRSLGRTVRRNLGVPRSWFENRDAEREFWGVILAHHGDLPPIREPEPALWDSNSEHDPQSALVALAETLKRMAPEALSDAHEPLPSQTRFQHAFAGFVTLADWIASDENLFVSPDAGAPSDSERVAWAMERASAALRRYGIDPSRGRSAADRHALDFKVLFPDLPTPRPAQKALLDAPLPDAGQVTVLEAETGSGTTEAALVHFLRLFQAGKVDGLYFALPTRAAAVQIHARVKNCIRRWLGDAAPPVGLAVPGYLRVDGADGERLPNEHHVLWPDEVAGRTWAVENTKRYLSGAVMVGTVDQVLLGGLRVRHAPFRSGPMLRLLLCIDEVHASDAYMIRLLRNVLQQHRAAGGHALLMSATLGSRARLRLLKERVEKHEIPDATKAAAEQYPSIQRSDEDLQALPPDGARRKRVTVELRDPEADYPALMERIRTAAEFGAVILFVRNRVNDAVETVRRLEELGAPVLRCQGVIAPHHGRFALEDRRLLDSALEEAFRIRKGVVAVTTQTAEQSLDIDADWLVTDIAPGDVLLQRTGRLHRHERTPRPRGFATARVVILAPTPAQLAGTLNPQGRSTRGRTMLGLGSVYENMVGVLATRAWLAEHGEVRIPENNRALVEAATHPGALCRTADALGGPWPAHLEDVEGRTVAHSAAASSVAVDWCEPLTENSPAEDLRARTRLGLDDRNPESRRSHEPQERHASSAPG